MITMGCGDACPFFPGKRYEDWDLDDPAGQGIDAVRPIRDEIRRPRRGADRGDRARLTARTHGSTPQRGTVRTRTARLDHHNNALRRKDTRQVVRS